MTWRLLLLALAIGLIGCEGARSDVGAPEVRLTEPLEESFLRTVTRVQGEAMDDSGVSSLRLSLREVRTGAQRQLAAVSVHSAPEMPYRFSAVLDPAEALPGEYCLVAEAFDPQGNRGEATRCGLRVPDAASSEWGAPSISMRGPASGGVLSGTVPIEGQASAEFQISRLELFAWRSAALQMELLDSITVAVPAKSVPFAFSLDTSTLSDGEYCLLVRAQTPRGAEGLVSTCGLWLFNRPELDRELPALAGLCPQLVGMTVSGSFKLTGLATDDFAVERVALGVWDINNVMGIPNKMYWVDEQRLASPARSVEFSLTLDSAKFPDGVYAVSVQVSDLRGSGYSQTTSGVRFNNSSATDVAPPIVGNLRPALWGQTVSGQFSVTGTATDNVAVARISLASWDLKGVLTVLDERVVQSPEPSFSFSLAGDTDRIPTTGLGKDLRIMLYDTSGNASEQSLGVVVK